MLLMGLDKVLKMCLLMGGSGLKSLLLMGLDKVLKLCH